MNTFTITIKIKTTETSEIAKSFNKYCIDIPMKLDHNLPPPTTNPLTYLTGNYPTSMAVPTVEPQDVTQIINSLKSKKKSNNIHEISVSVIQITTENNSNHNK